MRYFVFIGLTLLIFSCKRSEWPDPSISKQESMVAFYNVENLFDTLDAPYHDYQEFLPYSSLNWDTEKYQTKLDRIATVIEALHFPEIIGLAEVENADVLEDLVRQNKLSKEGYNIVHRETKDHRGIDCALMYKDRFLYVEKVYLLPINIPDPDYTGREALFIEGKLKNTGDKIVISVVHWPSRSGGLEKTEPRRIAAATQIRDHIQRAYDLEEIHFIMMGDFNDEPDNKSLSVILDADPPAKLNTSDQELYNMSFPAFRENIGTYNYRGNWNMLDQMIVSHAMADCSDQFCLQEVKVYKAEGLLFNHPEYGPSPNRTAGGPNYYGGFSDHLPVYAPLITPAAR